MSDFYCSGCSKWARSPHYCPGRQIKGKPYHYAAGDSESAQREKLERRKAELERELNEINARLGGVE
ncbi:hypothetical protein OZ656_06280 [Marinobacter sp. LM1]|uniref:hypothetical protein n=1 Tax=Marinobacter sp. LM1 TaxID=3003349 RepID=UPI0036D2539C